jgi:hypothetical protein
MPALLAFMGEGRRARPFAIPCVRFRKGSLEDEVLTVSIVTYLSHPTGDNAITTADGAKTAYRHT